MPAHILPFPAVARPHEVDRIARRVSEAPADKAEDCLVELMVPIARRMQRARVGDSDIQRELSALQAAVMLRVAGPLRRQGGDT